MACNKCRVQSVIFDKRLYDKTKAERYLKRKGFKTSYYNKSPYTESTNWYRYRQFNPNKYKSYYTQTETKGVRYIMGKI